MERAYEIVGKTTQMQFDRIKKPYDCWVRETWFSGGSLSSSIHLKQKYKEGVSQTKFGTLKDCAKNQPGEFCDPAILL